MKLSPLLLLAVCLGLSGCVSFGLECRRDTTNAWVKVRRVGIGVSKSQAEALSVFKEKVCLP